MKLTKRQERLFRKRDLKIAKGAEQGLVYMYPDLLFDRLRPYCVGGLPASIILFINELCNGHCYDRSVLMSLAFDDCKIVHAYIDSLRIWGGGKKMSEHSFVETKINGKECVIDTSIGLIYDKKFYYKLEKPKINRVFTKEECMNFRDVKKIIASNFNEDKYALPMYLPFVELALENSSHIGTVMYRDKIKKEIAIFKEAIDYEGICKEIDDDMRLMRTNPEALDEKFKIKRDEHGREYSRNGVDNPYYKTMEEIEMLDAEYEMVKNDKQKRNEFFAKLVSESLLKMKEEDEDISKKAEKRLKEIKQNPAKNCYEEKNK